MTQLTFQQWYLQLQIARPPIEAFVKLPMEFRTGVYLAFIEYKGYILTVSTIGYKLRKGSVPFHNNSFVVTEVHETEIPLITSYEIAIKETFKYLETPF